MRTLWMSVLGLCLGSFFLSTSLVQAQTPPQQALNLTVAPISLFLNAEPGGTAVGTMRVRNNSAQSENLVIEVVPFEVDPTTGTPRITSLENTGEAFLDWVSLSQNSFSAFPGEWQTITVEFSPPSSASPYYYYAFLVKRSTDVEPAETGTSLTGAAAVLGLAQVQTKNAFRELQLQDFKIPRLVFEFLPVDFSIYIRNSGNQFVVPKGNIFISSGTKKDIAVLPLNQGSATILPESTRELSVPWNEGFPRYELQEQDSETVLDAKGNPKSRLVWDFTKLNTFRIGKYQAHLIMVYDDGAYDVPVESRLSFWVIPWRILAVGLVIVVLLGLGLRSMLMPLIRKVKK